MKKLLSQRGAMFGIDARIAIAIVGALSLVGGATMVMTSADVKSKALIKDYEAYKAAIEGMQYDLKKDIYAALTSGGVASEKAMQALNDKTVLKAADQNHWLGPYLKGRQADVTKHENYGMILLHKGTKTDPGDSSCNPCYYWLKIEDVPFKDFENINDMVDGTEGSPTTTGRVMWRGEDGSNPDRIFFMITKTL